MMLCLCNITKANELGDLEDEAVSTGMEGEPADPMMGGEGIEEGDEEPTSSGTGGDMDGDIVAEQETNPNEEEEINNAMESEGIMTNNPMSMMQSNAELEPTNQAEIDAHHEEMENGDHQFDPSIQEEQMEGDHMVEGDGEHEEGFNEEEVIDHGLIVMDHHSELEKMKNFKKISEDCNLFLEEFRQCLDDIPDPAWEETEIQKCVGKDFTRIVNTISKVYINLIHYYKE